MDGEHHEQAATQAAVDATSTAYAEDAHLDGRSGSHQTVSRVSQRRRASGRRRPARVQAAIAELGYRRNQSARLLALEDARG